VGGEEMVSVLGEAIVVDRPGDAEVLYVVDAAGEGAAGFPGVGQLFVVHR
jgi:hypothetical protein